MKIDGMDAAIQNNMARIGQPDAAARAIPDGKPLPQQNETDQGANYQVSEAFIKKAVDKANHTMAARDQSLEFKIHEKTHDIIVKIIDTNTKEVIREIPSEKILDMVANMLELAGLLVDERR